MDSPLVTKLFRRLFSHKTCSRTRVHAPLPFRISGNHPRKYQYHGFSKEDDNDEAQQESHWQPRTDIYPEDKSRDFKRFPMVTADDLRGRRERPRRVKMLARDFIEGMFTSTKQGPQQLS